MQRSLSQELNPQLIRTIVEADVKDETEQDTNLFLSAMSQQDSQKYLCPQNKLDLDEDHYMHRSSFMPREDPISTIPKREESPDLESDYSIDQKKNHFELLKSRQVTEQLHGFWCWKLTSKQMGYLAVISGLIWRLFVGSNFMIGALAPYFQSYFEESTLSQVNTLFSTNIFFSMFGNFVASNLFTNKVLHPRTLILIGGILGIGGIYASSFVGWEIFMFLFPASFGLATGFTIMPILFLSWKYIPGNVNMLTGLFNSAFGFGAFTFTYLGTDLVNPHQLNPTKTDANGNKLYPFEVAQNVPFMLQTICYIWIVLLAVTLMILPGYPNEPVEDVMPNNDSDKSENLRSNVSTAVGSLAPLVRMSEATRLSTMHKINRTRNSSQTDKMMHVSFGSTTQGEQTPLRFRETPQYLSESPIEPEVPQAKTLCQILQDREFWLLYFIQYSSVVYGVFYLGSYKSFGEKHIQNESFLSLVASVSSFFGVFRFIWSLNMQKTSFKLTYGILIMIQIILAFSVPFIVESESISPDIREWVYMTSVSLIQLTEGGHFVLYPVILARMYGPDGGSLAYSVGFSFVGVASLTNTLIQPMLFEDDFKMRGFSFIFGSMSVISLALLTICFKEPAQKVKNVLEESITYSSSAH